MLRWKEPQIRNLSNEPMQGRPGLLTKGLTFIPTSTPPISKTIKDIEKNMDKLLHNCLWADHYKGNNNTNIHIKKIYVSQTKKPNNQNLSLHQYIQECKKIMIARVWNRSINEKTNFYPHDMKNLKRFLTINTCQRADKGLGIVVVNKDWELKEATRHLSDTTTYRQTTLTEFDKIYERCKAYLRNYERRILVLTKHHRWSKNLKHLTELNYLNKTIPRLKLYIKIHKATTLTTDKDLKGRPIVACFNSLTSPIAAFVDYFLQPVVRKHDRILLSSEELVQALSTTTCPDDCVFAVFDVESLYPNIPTKFGLQLVERLLYEHYKQPFLVECIVEGLKIVLECNLFKFKDNYYVQKTGTAMGVIPGPSYANLFVYMLFRELINSFLQTKKLHFYRRQLDDIVCLGTKQNLQELQNKMNSLCKSIRLTGTIGSTVDFLNMTLSVHNGIIQIRPYAKKFSKFEYIPFASAHPKTMKKAFITSLVRNMVLFSSTFDIYLEELQAVHKRLRSRGYPSSLINPIIEAFPYSIREKILQKPRDRTQKYKHPKVPFLALEYNERTIAINPHDVLRNNWNIVYAETREVFTKYPKLSWRLPDRIRDIFNRIDKKRG